MANSAQDISITWVRPRELSGPDRELWRAWRAARPELDSPYFDIRYTLAAGEVAPHAAVAIVRRGGQRIAFLPLQRRAGRIQPLAAPLSDYHGVIAAPGETIALSDILRALGATRFRFTGLVGQTGGGEANVAVRKRMAADLSGGFDAYLAARAKAGQGGFLKDKRRRLRALERDHGAVTFAFEPPSEELLDLVVRAKRRQMTQTGQVDVFSPAWTVELLRRLASRGGDFGVRFAVLRVGGHAIAAEAGLLAGSAYHLWFPVYDPEFAKYSPGVLNTLESLRALAERGVRTVDFGLDGEAYKAAFAEAWGDVLEGDVFSGPFYAALVATARSGLNRTPRLKRWVKGAAARLDRRFDRIAALRPHLGVTGSLTALLLTLSRRRPDVALAFVAAVSLGASLLSFD